MKSCRVPLGAYSDTIYGSVANTEKGLRRPTKGRRKGCLRCCHTKTSRHSFCTRLCKTPKARRGTKKTHELDGCTQIARHIEDLDCNLSVAIRGTMNLSKAPTTEVCLLRKLELAQLDEDGVRKTPACRCDSHEQVKGCLAQRAFRVGVRKPLQSRSVSCASGKTPFAL
jgi:hypothetical protein